MFRSKTPNVRLSIRRKVLDEIFDECDRFDVDETGGRVIGTYRKNGRGYEITVLDVIGPGPNARRTPTSFFQDGEYQEKVFRAIEEKQPDIEHLGNWHTHHVNGLQTLSSGDKATYRRIVNHEKHNTDFFYALLVVAATPHRKKRYEIRHYLLFRNDDSIHEIPDRQVEVFEEPETQPAETERAIADTLRSDRFPSRSDANLERAKDQEFFSEFYPDLKAVFSKSLGALCWKGRLALVDGSQADVVALEDSNHGKPSYSIALARLELKAVSILEDYKDRTFKSARHAILHLEKNLNRELYESKKE